MVGQTDPWGRGGSRSLGGETGHHPLTIAPNRPKRRSGIFEHINLKKLMVIHNLQTLLRLLVTIVHTKYIKNISICKQTHCVTHGPCVRIRSFFRYVDTLFYTEPWNALTELLYTAVERLYRTEERPRTIKKS